MCPARFVILLRESVRLKFILGSRFLAIVLAHAISISIMIYSLEELPSSIPNHIQLTPRSMLAVQSEGILPEQLLTPTMDQVVTKYNDKQNDPEILQQRLGKQIAKRNRLLTIALEARKNIIQKQNKIFEQIPSQNAKIKNQYQAIERLRQVQRLQVERAIEYEIITRNSQKQIENKMLRKQRLLAQQHKSMEEMKKRQSQLKELKESSLQKKLREHESRWQQKKHQLKRRQLNRQKQSEQKKKQHQKELYQKSLQRKYKQQMFQQQMDRRLNEQANTLNMKKLMMESKQQAKQRKIAQSKQQIRQHIQIMQEKKLRKVNMAKKRNQYEQEKFRTVTAQKLVQKQKKQDIYKRQLSVKGDLIRRKAQFRLKKQETVAKLSEQIQRKKTAKYIIKSVQAQRRKAELQKSGLELAQMKKNQRHYKETHREEARQAYEQKKNLQRERIVNKIADKQKSVMEHRKSRQKILKVKHNEQLMKRMERQDTKQRIFRKQEFERKQILEKLTKKLEQQQRQQQQRHNLMVEKENYKKQLSIEKQHMMQQIELVKRGKIQPQVLLQKIKTSSGSVYQQFDKETSSSKAKSPHQILANNFVKRPKY